MFVKDIFQPKKKREREYDVASDRRSSSYAQLGRHGKAAAALWRPGGGPPSTYLTHLSTPQPARPRIFELEQHTVMDGVPLHRLHPY